MLPISIKLDKAFFAPEEQWGFKVTEERKKLWAVELDLLIKLDEVCKRENIKYYIDAGTLLGAVRHKGFIPWDDDIDVMMFREDYEKFLNLPEDAFPEPYFVHSPHTDSNYLRPHIQLRNSKTTAIVKNEGVSKLKNQGIFLDIFPMDVVSRYRVLRAIKLKYMRMYYTFISRAKYGAPGKSAITDAVADMIYRVFHRISNEKMMAKYDNMAKHCMFPDDMAAKMSFWPLYSIDKLEKYRLPVKAFAGIEYLTFHGFRVPAPKGWDEILRIYYGDNYMAPRYDNSVHGGLLFDAEKPFTEYLVNECKSDSLSME